MATKIEEAFDVLTRAQEQILSEIAACGNNGGVGRAQNYAPVLVNVSNALKVVNALQKESNAVSERMAELRAAKAAKQNQNA